MRRLAAASTPACPKTSNADFAYTFDGGAVGEIEYESFSADGATVKITGVSIHPGLAHGKLVNALHLAAKIITALPANMTPETTAGPRRLHPPHRTDPAPPPNARLKFILRDFERDGLAAKGALLQQICAAIAATDPRADD